MWIIDHKPVPYRLSRAFLYSFAGHVGLVVFVVIASWILPLRKRQQIQWLPKNTSINVTAITPAEDQPVKGEKRTYEIENAAVATPTPKPTPKPKPTPERKTIQVPDAKPTPRATPERKIAKVAKKKIKETPKPTPEPTPEATPKPTPLPKKTPQPVKEVVKVAPAATPPPPPRRSPPKGPAPKGDPKAEATAQEVPKAAIDFGEGVTFPAAYGSDAVRRLREHFRPPSHLMRGENRTCVVQFTVRNDGRILESRIARSTGIPGMDNIALQAVRETMRLLPFKEYTDRDTITATVPFLFGSQ